MSWEKSKIITDKGNEVLAQTPIIISASRSTDIPAFYSDWFFERLKKGYVKWLNPFNRVPLFVSFEKARLFVFWSKNPKPIFKHLKYLDDRELNYYFQFTLNDYDKENFEERVPSLESRIETFIKLSEIIGKEKVIWRFDPYILTKEIGVDELLKKTENIGNKLKNYTNKMVFSFADIGIYSKVKKNLERGNINFQEFDKKTMNELASGLNELNKKWKFKIGTCTEKIDLDEYGILHNKCIDDDLIIELFNKDKELMDFLGVKIQTNLFKEIKTKNLKDKGQRTACGCIMSKDIGQYNTCPFGCVYCYANDSKEIALKNFRLNKANTIGETIIGK